MKGKNSEPAPAKPTYLLRLSQEHAAAVSRALEITHRADMGQWRIVMEHYEGKNGDWQKQREQGLEAVTDHLQRILCPDLSPVGGYGYGSEKTGKSGQLTYEVKNCLDHRRAWAERPPAPGDILAYGRNHSEPCLFPSDVRQKPQCSTEDGIQPELAANGIRIAREIERELGTQDIKEALRIIRQLKANQVKT